MEYLAIFSIQSGLYIIYA